MTDVTVFPRPDTRDGTAPGTAHLRLIAPTALPPEIALDPVEAERIRSLLSALLAALDLEPASSRVAALRRLCDAAGTTADHPLTAGTAETRDFDRYFNVRRIETAAPGPALVAGLMHCAASALDLSLRAPALPPGRLEEQRAGFASHARLLARVCGLGALS